MKKKQIVILVSVILIFSVLGMSVLPVGARRNSFRKFIRTWRQLNNYIDELEARITVLEENYEDLLERVTILEGGGTVECDPGTADCDDDPTNGCEHEYLDPVVGCEGGVRLVLYGQDENTFEFSENYEVTYSILLTEAPHGPGVPPSPSDLELRCLLTCSDSLYSLTLYDSDCEVISENTDQVSYTVIDGEDVDSAELTLKVVYESGCPCSPWVLTIDTGPEF